MTTVTNATVPGVQHPSLVLAQPLQFSSQILDHRVLSEVANGRITLEQRPDKTAGIEIVQAHLKALGHRVQVNGVFDQKTRLAVEAFQRRNNLGINGRVDNETLSKIDVTVTGLQGINDEIGAYLAAFAIAESISAKGIAFKEIIFKNLERGPLQKMSAIVLHRTDSITASSTLNTYGTGRPFGAHYLIDVDGMVYQTANLDKKASHVGWIKSKCFDENTCSAEETRIIQVMNLERNDKVRNKTIHDHEKVKLYPIRYPMNEDSIGIEVVGLFKNGTYGPPTAKQLKSLDELLAVLKKSYNLTDDDIYLHGITSPHKKSSEGQYLGYD